MIRGIDSQTIHCFFQCQSNIWLPAQRFHKIFVQKVMVSFHRSDVDGELGI